MKSTARLGQPTATCQVARCVACNTYLPIVSSRSFTTIALNLTRVRFIHSLIKNSMSKHSHAGYSRLLGTSLFYTTSYGLHSLSSPWRVVSLGLGELLLEVPLAVSRADLLQLSAVVAQLLDGLHLLSQEVVLDEVAHLSVPFRVCNLVHFQQ